MTNSWRILETLPLRPSIVPFGRPSNFAPIAPAKFILSSWIEIQFLLQPTDSVGFVRKP